MRQELTDAEVSAYAGTMARWIGRELPARLLLLTLDGMRAWLGRRVLRSDGLVVIRRAKERSQ